MFDKRLAEEGRPVRKYLLLTIGISIAGAFLAVAQAWFLSQIIAGVFLERATLKMVWHPLCLILAIILLKSVLQWSAEICAHEAASGIKASLRSRLIGQVVSLGPVYARGERAGELITVIVDGIESLEDYFAKYLPQLLLAAGIPLLILGFVFPQDWKSGLILLLTGPLIPVFMILIGKLAEKKSLEQWQSLSRMSAHFLDVLQGLTTLKVFGRAKDQARVISRVSESFRLATLRVLRIAFLSAFVLELLATLSTALVAVSIGLRLVYGTLSFSVGLFLLLLAPEFYTPLRTLGLNFHAGLSGVNAARRIFEILDLPVAEKQTSEGIDSQKINLSSSREESLISFRQVSLTYEEGETPALKEINLSLGSGEKIALVGPSGAGKSSIAQLLLRFVNPSAGKILVQGQLLETISLEYWHEQIAYVPQNPYLFSGSIAENILIGKPSATMEELKEAAQQSSAHQFIMKLPEGYQTLLGEGGTRLSGGQAQRLAIARAFLKNAPLLILDEMTSSLDSESEYAIQQALQRLLQGKTALIIAHRLTTVRQVDRIFVMERGGIIEQGNHEELMTKQGLYSRMVSEYRGEAI
ncbi:thiol reductant ABC exporter subunit CydD [Desulfosporosinus sp. PR]|uniref:thiol reductant ABC exporter subunit CydD n=1 Tax=Candidatus Desulfosporosinus nitrosoreducens TaxID=3401928 RepID=UPI0027F9CD62|nr:thiol reductant ABC exporter subunit CydD [Desulfosporosinus sp. PR]MDQ7095064.1 thiol reductant ABC exporter subunit CydD [Desulfosporosinus sp. PR]